MQKSAQVGNVTIKKGQSFDFFQEILSKLKVCPQSRPNSQSVHFSALIFFHFTEKSANFIT